MNDNPKDPKCRQQREELIGEVRKQASELRRLAHIIAIAPLDMFNNEDLSNLVHDIKLYLDLGPELPGGTSARDDESPTNNVGGWAYSICHESDDFNDWDAQYDFSGVI
jgi:hypothetical protein